MSVYSDAIRYACDWLDEHKNQCEHEEIFATASHAKAARDAGWGAYTNADIRRKGSDKLWFCPTHAIVFGNNHGWGWLEHYEPPSARKRRRWWVWR